MMTNGWALLPHADRDAAEPALSSAGPLLPARLHAVPLPAGVPSSQHLSRHGACCYPQLWGQA